MAEIAGEVGIRKPSLYHHVRKKEDLLFAIHEQLIDELIEQTTHRRSTPDSPEERVRRILQVSMSFVARHRDGVTVFLQERREMSGERWDELVIKRDRYERMVSAVIAEGIRPALHRRAAADRRPGPAGDGELELHLVRPDRRDERRGGRR